MPKFSRKSLSRLETCHPDLQKICKEAIKHYDFSILEGHRTNERQEELFHEGRTKLKGGESKHNIYPSVAIDLAPYPIDWNDKTRFYHFAGFIKGIANVMGIKLRWGGDWNSNNNFKDQSFFDLPHFELAK